ncbi:hypothetical protein APHAL10511_007150 [Amanita phalloides]|nr:hypothetical protein APHAL10511_007150 [Amanita phalloides]
MKYSREDLLTFSFGFLGCTLSSLFPVLYILESLLLHFVDKLQLRILSGNFAEIDFLRIIAEHGGAYEAFPKIFCTCTDACGVVGGLENRAPEASQPSEAGGGHERAKQRQTFFSGCMSVVALCLRCRLEQPAFLLQKRFLRRENARAFPRKRRQADHLPPRRTFVKPDSPHNYGPSSLDNIPNFFVQNIRAWSTHPRVQSRLRDFGIPTLHVRPLLYSFAAAVKRGELHGTNEHWEKYGLARFGQGLRELSVEQAENQVDIIYSTIFFTWASECNQQEHLVKILPELESSDSPVSPSDTLSLIQRLSRVASRKYPAEEFPTARRMQRRIIMHVGPTNSGKTHHALRALAAAPTGVYAGPLRLLAHEVWERLNLGEITPLGIDDMPSKTNVHNTPDKFPDHFHMYPALIRTFNESKKGNLAYSRICNMITGEEQKIICNSAPLLSCTVEMLSTRRHYDVAIVDEIQMIGDKERGAGWTSAVLGLCASELHLCGEESAVPIVKALLRETGDEIEVRRYERLTPLEVEEQSLDGDYGNVRKGDCVIAFSRHGIFGIKSQIEEKTGMRCAVVYGKLPPEVRSEQARLFNSDSGYDVIIGSDAIGMGLNLFVLLCSQRIVYLSGCIRKIRRIIFDDVAKWSDGRPRHLSASQVKQIAGRAGRYGLHSTSSKHATTNMHSLGGYATTLYRTDLPFLKHALAAPMQPLLYARLGVRGDTFAALAHVLPRGASTFTIYEAHVHAGRLGDNYRYAMPDPAALKDICKLVDKEGGKMVPAGQNQTLSEVFDHLGTTKTTSAKSLTIEDRMIFCLAPISWRDPRYLLVMERLIKMYRATLRIDLGAVIKGMGLMEAVEGIESREVSPDKVRRGVARKGAKRRRRDDKAEEIGEFNQTTLGLLEMFHKIVALYLWMSFRNPTSWGDRDEVGELKTRVEHALERCLEGLSRKVSRNGVRDELRSWRREGTQNKPKLELASC